jgi:hypothetical protein
VKYRKWVIRNTKKKPLKVYVQCWTAGRGGDSFGLAATKQLTLAAEVATSGISPKQQKINGSCG